MKKTEQNKNFINTEAKEIRKHDLNTLKMIISPEVVSQFLDEANELLNSVEQNLLALEKTPSSKELVPSAFRAIHTLKGNAGFMEYTDIVTICHKAESFLDILRSGTSQINSEQISLLLQIVDSLRRALENLTQDRPPLIAGKIGLIELMDKVFKLNGSNDKNENKSISNKKKNKEENKNSGDKKASESSKTLTAKNENLKDFINKTPSNGGNKETTEFIRVDVNKLNRLMDLVGEIVISESMVAQNPDLQLIESPGLEKSIRNHQKNVSELQELATSMRMIPLTGILTKCAGW